jgi:hypothetical protein
MNRGRSTVSKAKSYKEIADFWDSHDLSDFWEQTKKAEFEVDVKSEITYYSLDKKLSEQVQSIAQRRGVSADTLINLWVQEKLQEQNRT